MLATADSVVWQITVDKRRLPWVDDTIHGTGSCIRQFSLPPKPSIESEAMAKAQVTDTGFILKIVHWGQRLCLLHRCRSQFSAAHREAIQDSQFPQSTEISHFLLCTTSPSRLKPHQSNCWLRTPCSWKFTAVFPNGDELFALPKHISSFTCQTFAV